MGTLSEVREAIEKCYIEIKRLNAENAYKLATFEGMLETMGISREDQKETKMGVK